MFSRVVPLLLCVALLPHVTGCSGYKTEKLAPASFDPARGTLVGITTSGGQEIRFDEAAEVRRDTVYATVHGAPFVIPVGEVQRAWVREPDEGRTAVRSFGLLAGMVIVALGVGAILGALY
ncbi:MAG TPA: hypothetical protein VEK78_06725 [Gemmatimonadales bacterium]|nr:hypothetical protein [Gemmatimonadales bacterium]